MQIAEIITESNSKVDQVKRKISSELNSLSDTGLLLALNALSNNLKEGHKETTARIEAALAKLDKEDKEALKILLNKEAEERDLSPSSNKAEEIIGQIRDRQSNSLAKGNDEASGCLNAIIGAAMIVGGLSAVLTYDSDVSTPDTPSSYTQEVDPYQIPAKNVGIQVTGRRPVGFGNSILELDFKLTNNNPYRVKDIKIKCTHRGKSNTVVDTTVKTIYDYIRPNSSLSLKDVNMGFMHSQTHYVSCKVVDAERG